MGFKARAAALGLTVVNERTAGSSAIAVERHHSPDDTPYGLAALSGLCFEVISAGATGGRDNAFNQACLRAGHFIRDGRLTRGTAEAELRQAALSVSDSSDFTGYKIEEKLRRVIDQGIGDDYVIDYGPDLGAFPDLRTFVPHEVHDADDALIAAEIAEDYPQDDPVTEFSSPTPPEDVAEAPPAEAAPIDREAALQQWQERAVHKALLELRVKHEATLAHRAELAAQTFREPPYRPTLTAELMVPDEPVQYAIDELLPIGGNALLAAQYKTGKTTVIGDYARAFADGRPFLDRFNVNPAGGRLAIWNYELSDSQYRRWLRELGVVNTDAIVVLHLRGFRLPITAPSVEDWIVRWLAEHEVTAWVPDPFARAATGTDENSNTEVGIWLDTLDVIKDRAGVRDLVLPTHTGRAEQEQGQERARGATRLDDWADVRWLLTKDDTGNRFFRATGRDVEVDEELLTYNEADRSLRFGGGDRGWVKKRDTAQRVLDYINANPGCTASEVANCGGNKQANASARDDLVRRHKVRVEDVRIGKSTATRHYANEVSA